MTDTEKAQRRTWFLWSECGNWIRNADLAFEEFYDSRNELLNTLDAFSQEGRQVSRDNLIADRLKWHRINRWRSYILVSTLASCMRNIAIAAGEFDELSAYKEECPHITEELRELRGMLEHAEEYHFRNGKYPEKWIRESEGGISDGSSQVSVDGEILLGGRLNVRIARQELEMLRRLHDKIPEPEISQVN